MSTTTTTTKTTNTGVSRNQYQTVQRGLYAILWFVTLYFAATSDRLFNQVKTIRSSNAGTRGASVATTDGDGDSMESWDVSSALPLTAAASINSKKESISVNITSTTTYTDATTNTPSIARESVYEALQRGGGGVVLSDIRDGAVSRDVLWWLEIALPALPPQMPIELFVSTNAVLDKSLKRFIKRANRVSPNSTDYHPITVRRTPRFSDQVPGIDLNSRAGSHIAKFYAMLHSSWDFPIYFDSDVWLCQGWYEKLLEKAAANPDGDLIWTLSTSPFGATKGISDVYVSKEQIDPVVEEYKRFPERQGGTIIVARRTFEPIRTWLLEAMHVFTLQTTNNSEDNSYADGSEGMLRRSYTDQAALREATFLHRHEINEVVFAGEGKDPHGDQWACRSPGRTEACQCDPCLLIHHRNCFKYHFTGHD